MKAQRTSLVVMLALALSFPLTSCGTSHSSADEKTDAYYGAASAATEDYDAYDEYSYAEAETEDAVGIAASGSTLNLTEAGADPASETQKLVYTASVSIDTTDYQATVAGLQDLMTSCGAFAEYENERMRGSQELHAIEVTLRVPAESYDALMAGIDGIGGTVTTRTSQVTNITRSYADNEAVIQGLEIQEQRLLDMMSQAETVEDMLLVEERLSEVQTQLNRARTSRESMDASVNLSTVSVTIYEVRYETTTGRTSYLTRVLNAFADMWDGLIEGIGDLIIGLIYALPAIVILALLVLLARKGFRSFRAKRARKAAPADTPVVPMVVENHQDAGDEEQPAQ
jgi:hypothetical protein